MTDIRSPRATTHVPVRSLASGALLAFAAAGAQAQSNVEIFGNISMGYVHHNGTSGPSSKLQSSLSSSNYLGFRGREDLGGGTSAIFSLATAVATDTGVAGVGQSFWSKNAYVGLANNTWGTIMLGRNDQFAPEICQTDVMCGRGMIHSLHPGNLDRIGGGQLSNMVKYVSPAFGPVRVRTYYAFRDRTLGTHGSATGGEIVYTKDNLSIVGSYDTIRGLNVTPGSPTAGIGLTNFFGLPAGPATVFALDKIGIGVLSARYSVGAMTYYATLARVNMKYRGQDEALKTVDLGAAYNFTPALSLAGGCSQHRLATSGWNTCQANLTYALSKRTNVYIADVYQTSRGQFARAQQFQAGGFSSAGGSMNTVAVGMRHTF